MRSKGVKNKILLRFALLFIVMILASQSVFANILLSEVEIKNSDNEYNITLRVNESAQVKKQILNEDKIILTVNNASRTVNLPVLYEGEKNIDNIVIKEKKNNVEIFLQGKDAAKSNIFVREMNSGLLKQIYSGSDKKSSFGSNFFLLDAKFSSLVILGLIFMFVIFAFVKPKNEMNKIRNLNRTNTNNTTSKVATIRNKIESRKSKTAPYIHYGANTNYSTIPSEFLANRHSEKGKIRKYG